MDKAGAFGVEQNLLHMGFQYAEPRLSGEATMYDRARIALPRNRGRSSILLPFFRDL